MSHAYTVPFPIITHAYCTYLLPQIYTLLISPSITHTNTLILSLTPCTYLLPSYYTFPILPTLYIRLLLPEMPHSHFHTHNDLSVSLSLCPFPLFSLPSQSPAQPYTHTYTILIFHDMTHTVSMHSDLVLSLSFTLPLPSFSQ